MRVTRARAAPREPREAPLALRTTRRVTERSETGIDGELVVASRDHRSVARDVDGGDRCAPDTLVSPHRATARGSETNVNIRVLVAGCLPFLLASCGAQAGNCTVADHGDGTATITCPDGTTAMVGGRDGTNGMDGRSCSVTDNGDGTATLLCDDGTSATIDDGSAGIDGTSCTVSSDGAGTSTITCEDGTTATIVDGADGADGSSCTVVDNLDGTVTIACQDGTTATVSDGAEGAAGAPGGSCTVASNPDGSATITCEDGSVATAAEGGSCSITTDPATNLTRVVCADGTSAVLNDLDGDGTADELDTCPQWAGTSTGACPCSRIDVANLVSQAASNGSYALLPTPINGQPAWRNGVATLAYGRTTATAWDITRSTSDPGRPAACDGGSPGAGPHTCTPWREWRGGSLGFVAPSPAVTMTCVP